MESSYTTFYLNNATTNTEHNFLCTIFFFLGFKNSSVSFLELAEERKGSGGWNPPRFASTKQKGDPQRSARIVYKIMQKDSGPENPKWATPHVTHAYTGTPLAALARG